MDKGYNIPTKCFLSYYFTLILLLSKCNDLLLQYVIIKVLDDE